MGVNSFDADRNSSQHFDTGLMFKMRIIRRMVNYKSYWDNISGINCSKCTRGAITEKERRRAQEYKSYAPQQPSWFDEKKWIFELNIRLSCN